MATQDQLRQLGNAVGFLSVADIQGLSNLLAKYGNLPDNISYQSLNKATIQTLSNPSFYQEFLRLVDANVKEVSQLNQFNNVSGFYNAHGMYSNVAGTTGATTPATTPASTGGNFFSGFNLNSLIGLGTTIYATESAGKQQDRLLEAQANQQAQQNQDTIMAGQLALETEKLKLAQIQAGGGQSGANNTLLYVGLGVLGLLVVGGVIYAVAKK